MTRNTTLRGTAHFQAKLWATSPDAGLLDLPEVAGNIGFSRSVPVATGGVDPHRLIADRDTPAPRPQPFNQCRFTLHTCNTVNRLVANPVPCAVQTWLK